MNKKNLCVTCKLIILHFFPCLVNQLINEGVIAIIGPKTSVAVKATHPLCSKLQIPQISASATDPDLYFNSRGRYSYLLRMSPDDTQMNIAITELIAHHKWKRMGILTASTLYGKPFSCHLNTMNGVLGTTQPYP